MNSAVLTTNHYRTNTIGTISNREIQVLELIAHEHTTKEIAEKLFVSAHTVDSHRKRMMMKWDVRNTAGLIRVGFESGVLKLNSSLQQV